MPYIPSPVPWVSSTLMSTFEEHSRGIRAGTPGKRQQGYLSFTAHVENTLFYAFKYDVKEFFTNVVITHVLLAIDFFIHKNEKLTCGKV